MATVVVGVQVTGGQQAGRQVTISDNDAARIAATWQAMYSEENLTVPQAIQRWADDILSMTRREVHKHEWQAAIKNLEDNFEDIIYT